MELQQRCSLLFERLKAKRLLILFCLLISSLFSLEKPGRLFFDGEILYWKPDQEGMTYCLVTDELTDVILGPNSSERDQHTNWHPGFRVGTGFRFAQQHGDVSVYWTHFQHTMTGFTVTDDLILGTKLFLGDFAPIGLFAHLGGGGVLRLGASGASGGVASSQWKLRLNLIECDFGFQICFDNRFSLHPYLGVKGGWINQQQLVRYDHFFDPNNNLFFNTTILSKNNFSGVGPELGIDGNFSIGYGFGLMGLFSGAFLYGSADSPVDYHIENDPIVFPFPDFSVDYQQQQFVPAIQAQIGLNWGKECFEYFLFYLNIAYEVQYFWNTWRNQGAAIQSIAVPDSGYGNLMLHGVTGEVQFAF